ncbi:MAG: PAS domain S-box protein, partial [Balneolales bacterium]|nr:PAS domain S-box protein [Balneolales bacterium]
QTNFLFFGGGILFLVALLNFLEHTNLAPSPDEGENFLITVFFPIFIFAIYSAVVKEEFKNKKEIENKTLRTNNLLNGMFEAIPILLILWDRHTQQLTINKEVEKRLGWEEEELKEIDLFNTLLANSGDLERARKAARNFEGIWNEYPIKTKTGEIRTQRWTRLALDENISIGIGIDITEQKKINLSLQKERRRFELISKSANDVLYEWDLETDTVWWSQGWITSFGFKEVEVGDSFKWLRTVIHPEDFEDLDRHYDSIKDSNLNSWYHTYRIIGSDGDIIHVKDTGYFIRNDDGKAIELVGALENVTEEKHAKQLLQQSKERYETFFKKNPMPLIIFDEDSLSIIEANDALLQLYEYSQEELQKLTVYDLYEAEHWDKFQWLANKYRGIPSPGTEFKVRTKSNKVLNLEITTTPINYLNKEFRLAAVKDITKQREAEAKAFSSFVEGENKERSRLAREIHDGIIQYLAASKMNLTALKYKLDDFTDDEKELFENGVAYLKQAMNETRDISHNLMPPILEDYGLALAVKTLVEDFEKGSKIECNYFQNIEDISMPKEIRINVYRITQECLNNILKHSEATSVSIQLIHDNSEFFLTVEDNGIGFDTDSDDYISGLGLSGIRSRVLSMGGYLDIDSKINQGSVFTIRLPLTTANKEVS